MHALLLANINLHTKFLGAQKCKNASRDPDHANLRVNSHPICVQNLTTLALADPEM